MIIQARWITHALIRVITRTIPATMTQAMEANRAGRTHRQRLPRPQSAASILLVMLLLLVAGCAGGAAGTGTTGGQSAAPPAASATSAASVTQTQAGGGAPDAQATTPAGVEGMNGMPGMEQAEGTGTQAGAAPTQQSAGNSGTGGASDATEVQATLREWAIDLSLHEVPAGKVRFTVNNQGQFTHNLTIISPSGEEVAATRNFSAADGPQTLEVDLQPGTYTLICSLPGHAARGQRTELTVK